jgi:hypothetical protein
MAAGIARADDAPPNLSKATFGGGCFWCTEAVYAQLKGVHAVTSGYIGGQIENPTYERSAPAERATPKRSRSNTTRSRYRLKNC